MKPVPFACDRHATAARLAVAQRPASPWAAVAPKCTKIWGRPEVVPAARFVAKLSNATMRPSPEIAGEELA